MRAHGTHSAHLDSSCRPTVKGAVMLYYDIELLCLVPLAGGSGQRTNVILSQVCDDRLGVPGPGIAPGSAAVRCHGSPAKRQDEAQQRGGGERGHRGRDHHCAAAREGRRWRRLPQRGPGRHKCCAASRGMLKIPTSSGTLLILCLVSLLHQTCCLTDC